MRHSLSRLNIFRRNTKKVALPSENVEKSFIDYVVRDMAIFENSPTTNSTVSSTTTTAATIDLSHPLQSVALSVKPKLSQNESLSKNFAVLNELIAKELELYTTKLNQQLPMDPLPESTLVESTISSSSGSKPYTSVGLTDEERVHKETVFRLTLGQQYFKALEESATQQPDLSKDQISKRINSLVDTVLLGTASERVEEHMKLYGDEMDQEMMQACFYPLYEAEIESANRLLKMYPISLQRHEKKIKKLSDGYLLDTLELNTKIRCIMAWSDPNRGRGYAPVSDDLKLPIDVIVNGRKEFFNEGETMARTYLTAVRGVVNMYYEQKKDNRELLRNGVIFFFVTCIADYIVCTM